MNAIKGSPKTSTVGIAGGGIIGLVQMAALTFGWEITPDMQKLIIAAYGLLMAVMGLIGKDGDK